MPPNPTNQFLQSYDEERSKEEKYNRYPCVLYLSVTKENNYSIE